MLVSTNKPKKKLLNSPIAKVLRQWKYPLLSAYFFGLTCMVPRPACAALFQGYVDFAKKIFSDSFNAIGLGALIPFTDTISVLITGLVIVLVGAWIVWHGYKAVQEYDRSEFEGMWRNVIAAVLATVILFSLNFILDQIVA
ncbi:hypothetical protein [Merismopedia glauca]|uniref:Uncharacterized protein n=1 Tax=Merismopedia glauca CCAP 1448/3 TaxID=1296344 RepID=A0A2T1C2B9_9CYAN|nr:hypothetical protein [Merismopedia glauca]PSB02392.1 hypothetical protein C7B64_13480 [Merismopedia glauca CCAP 1448/3]